jgi:Mu-like prophage protein gp46
MTADYCDIALIFQSGFRRCDLALGPDGDLVMDLTPVTPMLTSTGSDRRARPDDDLPTGVTTMNAPSSFIERRGWVGDCLDDQGRLLGSRLWLLDRNKQTENTRRFAEIWAEESLAWVAEETGTPAQVSAQWIRRNVLALTCSIGNDSLTIQRPV